MTTTAGRRAGSLLIGRPGGARFRVEPRGIAAMVVLLVIAAAVGFVGLCFGDGWSDPSEVASALVGRGPIQFVVTEWRLPRVLAGLVLGAALGMAGAVFQNLTRNALGSPDVIGLDAGAYTGTLIVVVYGAASAGAVALGSVGAGLATAVAIYLLSLRAGFSGLRLVVVGVGVNAALTALNSWIVLRADIDVAIAVTAWSAGNLNGIGWDDVALPFAVIGVLSVVLLLAAHSLHQLALGDDVAVSSGVPLDVVRVAVLIAGVGLTATVTATAGPIVFIALTAPQIGRRLVRATGVPLLPAALVGATLLVAADVLAQSAFAPTVLPVGVVTTALGGGYLLYLLAREVR